MTAPQMYVAPDEQSTVEEPRLVVHREVSVRELVKAAKGIHPATRDVLAEICALYENGGKFCFDANNRFLAEKLGMTEPMISRHIRHLSDGLVTVKERTAGSRRTITPSLDLQTSYRSGKVENITEVVRTSYRSGKDNLTEVVRTSYRSGKDNLTEVVRKPYRSGKHKSNKENIEEEDSIDSVESAAQTASASAEEIWALLVKCSTKDDILATWNALPKERRPTKGSLAHELFRLRNNDLIAPATKPETVKGDGVAEKFPELLFDCFWDAYQHKTGSKKVARQKWSKLKEVDRRTILAGLPNYLLAHPDKEFRCMPQTFLEQRRWEAEDFGQTIGPPKKPENVNAHLAIPQSDRAYRYEVKPEYAEEERLKQEQWEQEQIEFYTRKYANETA